jgi:hypothetical protein
LCRYTIWGFIASDKSVVIFQKYRWFSASTVKPLFERHKLWTMQTTPFMDNHLKQWFLYRYKKTTLIIIPLTSHAGENRTIKFLKHQYLQNISNFFSIFITQYWTGASLTLNSNNHRTSHTLECSKCGRAPSHPRDPGPCVSEYTFGRWRVLACGWSASECKGICIPRGARPLCYNAEKSPMPWEKIRLTMHTDDM